ncbi:hypothetical protein [Methylocystis hirsuta]|nr:hypothetical protein [Methylocystis hirsuta]
MTRSAAYRLREIGAAIVTIPIAFCVMIISIVTLGRWMPGR